MFKYMQNCPIYFGPGAIDHLGEYVAELGSRKALCVFDPGVEAMGIADRAVASLKKAGIDSVCYGKIMSDPTIGAVDEAGALAVKEKVDVIIGIGGGSSMDAAKAVSILMTNPGPASKYILAKPIAAPGLQVRRQGPSEHRRHPGDAGEGALRRRGRGHRRGSHRAEAPRQLQQV